MLIEIDLTLCKKLQITPNQLIFLKILMDNNLKKIKEFESVITMKDSDIQELIDRGIIEPISSFDNLNKLILTEEFKLSLDNKSYFDEFYEAYPKYITRPDGLKDYLRTDMHRCRKFYEQLIGRSKSKHETIMKCLEFEVNLKRKTNKMSYMKRMPKWLLSQEWTVYEEMMTDEKVITERKEVSYGGQIE